MVDGLHFENFKPPYLCNHLSYHNEILYGDVCIALHYSLSTLENF